MLAAMLVGLALSAHFPCPWMEQGLGQLWVQHINFVAIPAKVS